MHSTVYLLMLVHALSSLIYPIIHHRQTSQKWFKSNIEPYRKYRFKEALLPINIERRPSNQGFGSVDIDLGSPYFTNLTEYMALWRLCSVFSLQERIWSDYRSYSVFGKCTESGFWTFQREKVPYFSKNIQQPIYVPDQQDTGNPLRVLQCLFYLDTVGRIPVYNIKTQRETPLKTAQGGYYMDSMRETIIGPIQIVTNWVWMDDYQFTN